MLKKITTSQLVRGMYVHKLCGSWLEHPFWKKTFLVTDEAQLALIRRSGIADVWIDTLRGLDVPVAAPDLSNDDWLIETMLVSFVGDAADDPPTACSLADELERAGRIVADGRAAMKAVFGNVRLGKAVDAEYCLPLVDEITSSIDRNPGAIVSLARLKTSDDYTYLHSVAVCALMVALARKLELPAVEVREAGLAGLVHDIGKAVMPVEILNKPGALTADELTIMRTHPRAGHALLSEANGVGTGALDVALHHHERIDGTGYPVGLREDGISIPARMGAICDVYDAITSDRPYKSGWDPALSIQKMAQWSREGHFDEGILQAFVKSIGIYPVGSLVRLSSQRLAVVVDQSEGSLLKPLVKPIFAIAQKRLGDSDPISLAEAGCRERIVSRESAATWGLTSIDDHWRLVSTPSAALARS